MATQEELHAAWANVLDQMTVTSSRWGREKHSQGGCAIERYERPVFYDLSTHPCREYLVYFMYNAHGRRARLNIVWEGKRVSVDFHPSKIPHYGIRGTDAAIVEARLRGWLW